MRQRIGPKTPSEKTVGAAAGSAQPKASRGAELPELVLEIQHPDRADDGAVDVAETADGDHHHELDAEQIGEDSGETNWNENVNSPPASPASAAEKTKRRSLTEATGTPEAAADASSAAIA